jgi:signal peptidase II
VSTANLDTTAEGPSLAARIGRRALRDLPFFLVAGGVYALDQLTKSLVRNNLEIGESWPSEDWLVKITHITNSGAAFGILQGQGIFLTVTAFVAIAAIFFYYAYPPLEHGLLRFALGLQLGGAIGNLTDRLRFGEVTDMFHFPHYPAFNVADSSIVVGLVIVVAFFVLRPDSKEQGTGNKEQGRSSEAGQAPADTPHIDVVASGTEPNR